MSVQDVGNLVDFEVTNHSRFCQERQDAWDLLRVKMVSHGISCHHLKNLPSTCFFLFLPGHPVLQIAPPHTNATYIMVACKEY